MEEEGYDSSEKNEIGKKGGLSYGNNTINFHHLVNTSFIEEKNISKYDSKQNDATESHIKKVMHLFERNISCFSFTYFTFHIP